MAQRNYEVIHTVRSVISAASAADAMNAVNIECSTSLFTSARAVVKPEVINITTEKED